MITIIPASDGVSQCSTRSLAKMMQMGNCADMMFSGHTAITYLTCPQKYRPFIVGVMGSILVLTKLHYTSDVIMAIIASRWIEYELPLKEAENEPEDTDRRNGRTHEQISSLIDESIDTQSEQRILATESDKEEDLECYVKQRVALKSQENRIGSVTNKSNHLIQDSQIDFNKISSVALNAIVGSQNISPHSLAEEMGKTSFK